MKLNDAGAENALCSSRLSLNRPAQQHAPHTHEGEDEPILAKRNEELTDTRVAGKNINVRMAIVRIALLSCAADAAINFESSATETLILLSR